MMNMRPMRSLCNSILCCLFLVVMAGCAQSRLAVKKEEKADNGTSVIKDLKVSSDALLVAITTDKPVTYTYYKTNDPPKAVIDLAQTEAGTVKQPVEVNAGTIKSISVSRHGFGGGFMSRVEVALTKDEEFTVNVDPADKNTLVVMFAKAQPAENRGTEEIKVEAPTIKVEDVKPASVSEAKSVESVASIKEPVGKLEGKTVVAEPAKTEKVQISTETSPGLSTPATESIVPPAVPISAAPISATNEVTVPDKEIEKRSAAVPAETAAQTRSLTALTAVNDGVEIAIAGGVDTYNSFKLTKPDRLVIDLFGVKSAIASKTVEINKFGIGKARIGLSPDKVRIVMDATRDRLPLFVVEKTQTGLKVVFAERAETAHVAVVPPTNIEPVKEITKPQVETKKIVKGGVSTVEAIDFKLVDGYSQIAVKTSGECNFGKPVKVAKGMTLTIKNCQIPKRLQRLYDTSAFASIVQGITPYQVKVKGGYDARIMVKMRGDAPNTIKQDGDTIFWDIKNPEFPDTQPLISEVPKAQPVAAIQREQVGSESGLDISHNLTGKTTNEQKKVYTGRKVSLEFSDADVRKIFQLIAEVSNLNFLIGDDVTGTISIKLVNVPWDQALDVILDSKGLEMKREGNIVQIKPRGKFKAQDQEEADAKKSLIKLIPVRTEIVDISFSSTEDMKKQLDKLATKGRDDVSVEPDKRTNRLILTDIPEVVEKMKRLVKELDLPEKQVMIEARIVEATSTFTRDLGVQWGLHYMDGTASTLGVSRVDTGFGGVVIAPPSSGSFGPGGAMGMSFGKLASNIQLDLRLSAAATTGQIKIISTPKVVTLNNKAAKISQGQSIPYQTTSAEGTKTEFVEAALTLEVTPQITADGTIGMKIKASNNSAGTGNPPPINKKEATTEMQVKNGETTVIGGIYVDSDTDQDQGVPFLSDIPLLGWLFKSNTKTKTKTELLIFITPRIIS